MADIENNQQKSRHHFKTSSKKSVRIDLTPMVDLGFLLITFFVFTTTMSQATVMNIVTPYDKVEPGDDICNSCALTVLLGSNDQIYYYEGAPETASLHTANYNSIRTVLQDKKKKVASARGSGDQFVLIIKAADAASFKNFVDITDEVTINGIKRYYIDEITAVDKMKMQEASRD